MTRKEARRRALLIAADLLDGSDHQGWMYYDDSGNELPEKDQYRMMTARDELAAQLRRRAEGPMRPSG